MLGSVLAGPPWWWQAAAGCQSGTRAVAQFAAARTGAYRVAVTTYRLWPIFSVHDGTAANWLRPHGWGIAALLVVTIGTSIVLVATTIPPTTAPRDQRR